MLSRRASLGLLGLLGCGRAGAGLPAGPRLVSVGGALTETVFALGAGGQLVGVDTSSTHPAGTAGLPRVGYQRALSSEGVLSLRPRRRGRRGGWR